MEMNRFRSPISLSQIFARLFSLVNSSPTFAIFFCKFRNLYAPENWCKMDNILNILQKVTMSQQSTIPNFPIVQAKTIPSNDPIASVLHRSVEQIHAMLTNEANPEALLFTSTGPGKIQDIRRFSPLILTLMYV